MSFRPCGEISKEIEIYRLHYISLKMTKTTLSTKFLLAIDTL